MNQAAIRYRVIKSFQTEGHFFQADQLIPDDRFDESEFRELFFRGLVSDDCFHKNGDKETGENGIWPPVPKLWPGEVITVIATGPSLKMKDLEMCRERSRVIVVNDAFRWAPWADALYACDPDWWKMNGPQHEWVDGTESEGAWKFKGLKITQSKDAANDHGLYFVDCHFRQGISTNQRYIHAGLNSGFQAFNLAVLFGASKIVLLGFDMRKGSNGKRHYFGEHPGVLRKDSPYPMMIQHFKNSLASIKKTGIDVINATPGSALNFFRHYPIDQALRDRPVPAIHSRRNGHPANVPQSWKYECSMKPKRLPSYPVPEDSRFAPRVLTPARPQGIAKCEYTGQISFACVLRPSNEFGAQDVDRLASSIQRNTKRNHLIYCLTEVPQDQFKENVIAVPLKHPEWITKHSKIELFRPDLLVKFGRTIYFDLDTVIMGSLDEICTYDGDFAMLRDFYCSNMNGSGLMAWGTRAVGLVQIYTSFKRTPKHRIQTIYPIGGGRGDQLFIRHHTPVAPHQIQDCFPGQIGSYKAHFQNRPSPTQKPRVICFHGKPKPSGINDLWIKKHWL